MGGVGMSVGVGAVGLVLLALTVVLLVIRSELRLALARISAFGVRVADGPQLGHPLAAPARKALRGAGVGSPDLLVLVSVGCEPCVTLLQHLTTLPSQTTERLTVVATGDGDDLDTDVRTVLPAGAQLVLDPGARAIHEACAVRLTPFGLSLVGGVVQTKGYLGPEDDLRWFLDLPRRPGEPSDGASWQIVDA